MTIFQEKNEDEQATGSYPFSIQAIAKGSFTRFSQGKNNTQTPKPINVKIKIQNVQENLIKNGVISASHVKRTKGSSKKMRLVNSDQTIMSFDLLVEDDLQKSKKNRNKIMQLLMPGRCLKSKTDDDKNPYIPCASEVTKKESKPPLINSPDIIAKSKFDEKYTEPITSKNQLVTSVILGKCKPGGCLDPSFSEEIYSYKPALRSEVISKNKPEDVIKSVNEKSDTTDNEASDDKKSEDQNVLEKNKYPDTLTNSLNTSSHGIITYPPSALSSSEVKTRKKSVDKYNKNRKSLEGKQRISQNDLTEVYFRPPKTNGKQLDGKNLSTTSEEQKKLDNKKGDIKRSVGKDTQDDHNFNNNLKNQPDKIQTQENVKNIAAMVTRERIKNSMLKNEDESAIFQEKSSDEISPMKTNTPEPVETVKRKKSNEHESEFENRLERTNSSYKNDDMSEYKKIEPKPLDGINTSNNLNKIEYADPSTDSGKVKIHGYGKPDELKEFKAASPVIHKISQNLTENMKNLEMLRTKTSLSEIKTNEDFSSSRDKQGNISSDSKADFKDFNQINNTSSLGVEDETFNLLDNSTPENRIIQPKDLRISNGDLLDYIKQSNLQSNDYTNNAIKNVTSSEDLVETPTKDRKSHDPEKLKVTGDIEKSKKSLDFQKDRDNDDISETVDQKPNNFHKQNLTNNIENLETLPKEMIPSKLKTNEDFSSTRDKPGNTFSDSNENFKDPIEINNISSLGVKDQTPYLLNNTIIPENRIIQPKDVRTSNGNLLKYIKESNLQSNDYTNNDIKNITSSKALVETPTKDRKSLDSKKPKVTDAIVRNEKSLDFKNDDNDDKSESDQNPNILYNQNLTDNMKDSETEHGRKETILSEIKTNEDFSSPHDKQGNISSDSNADFKDPNKINNTSSLGVEDQTFNLLDNNSTLENRIIQPKDLLISNGDVLNYIKRSNLQSNDYTNNAIKDVTSSEDLVELPTKNRKSLDPEKSKVTGDIQESKKSLDFQKDDNDDISETVNQKPNNFLTRNLTDSMENLETLPKEMILSKLKTNEDFSSTHDKHGNISSDSNADFKEPIEINNISSLGVEDQTSYLLNNFIKPENIIIQPKDIRVSNGDLLNYIKESNLQSNDYTNNDIKNVTSSKALVETPTKDRKSLDSEKPNVTDDIVKRKKLLDFRKDGDEVISDTVIQKQQKTDIYDAINNDLEEMKHRKTSDSVTNVNQIQNKETKESIDSIRNAPNRKRNVLLTSKIANESQSTEHRDYLEPPVIDKDNIVEAKQKSQVKQILKESYKIETQSNILLNFAFQTYLNSNNEKTIKTSNPFLKPLQHEQNSIITFTKSARINDELIIQIDSEIDLHVHIRKSNMQYPLKRVRTESKVDDATSLSSQKLTKKDILMDTLNTLYANNLLPVKDVINKLRKDINVMDNLQHTLKKDLNSKKHETKNLYHLYTNCSCLRN